jgi:hypothetical protein
VETGLAIAAVPALIGALAIERWRRRTVREWRVAEQRGASRRAAWEAVSALDTDAELDRAA